MPVVPPNPNPGLFVGTLDAGVVVAPACPNPAPA